MPWHGCDGEWCAEGDHKISQAHPRQPATQLLTPVPWQHAWQPRKLRSSTAACRGLSTGCPKPAALPWDECASKRRTEDGQIISAAALRVSPAKRRETVQQRPPPRPQRHAAAAYHHGLPIPRAKPTARRRRNGSGEWRAGDARSVGCGHAGRDRRNCSRQHDGSTSDSCTSSDTALQLAANTPVG